MLPSRGPGREAGSGSLLALAVIGAVLTVTTVMIPVFAVLAASQSVQNAADAAALAAADAASGAVGGIPCERAIEAARLNEAVVASCSLHGLIASVTVTRGVGVFTVTSDARAGPPSAQKEAEG